MLKIFLSVISLSFREMIRLENTVNGLWIQGFFLDLLLHQFLYTQDVLKCLIYIIQPLEKIQPKQ